MTIETSLKHLSELSAKRDEVHYAFIKHIMLLCTTVFSILVSLHKTTSTSLSIRISYSISLGLLAFGILLLSISLYSQVQTHRQLCRLKEEDLLRQLDDENNYKKVISVKKKKIYETSEFLAYCSLFLSLICLTTYAILTA